MNDRRLIIGGFYRHFKGNEYQVLNVARHSETREVLVVYQDMSGGIWAIPFEMFMSKVDREKYPDANQKYRFQHSSERMEV